MLQALYLQHQDNTLYKPFFQEQNNVTTLYWIDQLKMNESDCSHVDHNHKQYNTFKW